MSGCCVVTAVALESNDAPQSCNLLLLCEPKRSCSRLLPNLLKDVVVDSEGWKVHPTSCSIHMSVQCQTCEWSKGGHTMQLTDLWQQV